MASYKNYIGKDPLQDYENLVVPVHLPTEKDWLLLVIIIINIYTYVCDSAVMSANMYNTKFQALKQTFIKGERQYWPQEQNTLLHKENWEEKVPSCPKKKNDVDCGVFTSYFAKQMVLSGCNSTLTYGGDFRNEMVSDLLGLTSLSKNNSAVLAVLKVLNDCYVVQLLKSSTHLKCPKIKEKFFFLFLRLLPGFSYYCFSFLFYKNAKKKKTRQKLTYNNQ